MPALSQDGPGVELVERLRAAGYEVLPATRDTLPEPEHTLPPRRQGLKRLRNAMVRLWSSTSNHVRVKHASIP